jgi:hypothetical protein
LRRMRAIVSFGTRRIEHSVIAVAVAMRTGCPARHPSPKKSPFPKIATTASFPRGEDRQPHLPSLNVKNSVCRIALREDGAFLAILLRGPPRAFERYVLRSSGAFFLGAMSRPFMSPAQSGSRHGHDALRRASQEPQRARSAVAGEVDEVGWPPEPLGVLTDEKQQKPTQPRHVQTWPHGRADRGGS